MARSLEAFTRTGKVTISLHAGLWAVLLHSISMSHGRSASVGVMILAAGKSSRMGRPKMLLPWGETTVLGHLIKLWSDVPAGQIVVVYASADAAIEVELDRLKVPVENRIVNPEPDRGMFSSIQCAARWDGWSATLTHRAIVLGDQPHLQAKTLAAMVEFTAQHPEHICQPSRHGHARHPVLLPEKALRKLLQTMSAEVKLLEVNDPGLDLDMDHPADYEKALQLAFGK
jgi:molybdenum cofactor cytidylyltransferase